MLFRGIFWGILLFMVLKTFMVSRLIKAILEEDHYSLQLLFYDEVQYHIFRA